MTREAFYVHEGESATFEITIVEKPKTAWRMLYPLALIAMPIVFALSFLS